MNLESLAAAYYSEPQQAAALYEGKTYLFPAVTVDEVSSEHLTPQSYEKGYELYLDSGPVRFRPRYWQDLDSLGPGFVLDIVGEVRGWMRNNIHVVDCVFYVLEGGEIPEPYGY